jgi:transcriptional regulator with XRE-family HTH domain
MTDTTDQALSAFIDAWTAGMRPRLEDYLERVDPSERAALADAIDDFVTLAPLPPYDDEALRAIRAEAVGVATPSAALPSLVTRLRVGAGLTIRDLADRLGSALGVAGREAKLEGYVARLEGGELDGRRLSQRVLDALGRVLGADAATLDGASQLGGLAPAGIRLRGGDPQTAGEVRDRLEALADLMATPSPEEWDEVDELFLSGR